MKLRFRPSKCSKLALAAASLSGLALASAAHAQTATETNTWAFEPTRDAFSSSALLDLQSKNYKDGAKLMHYARWLAKCRANLVRSLGDLYNSKENSSLTGVHISKRGRSRLGKAKS